jgi:hypothetical protein
MEPDDFADQLKGLVTAQTVILTKFTIKRDKTLTIWDRPLIEMPEQILHRRRCALSQAPRKSLLGGARSGPLGCRFRS